MTAWPVTRKRWLRRLLGLSFGGMLASEIARMRPEQQVIIVSSAKSPAELEMPGKALQFIIHNGCCRYGLRRSAAKR